MEQGALISRLNKALPGAILETRRFGRARWVSLWVEARSVLPVAQALKSDAEASLDWLENLSVVELDDALVTTYFVSSTTTPFSVILRVSVVPESPEAWVEMPSVRTVWPMAETMEREAAEFFGMRFQLNGQAWLDSTDRKLPDNWVGFPLRKKYVFPTSVIGIPHIRAESKAGHHG